MFVIYLCVPKRGLEPPRVAALVPKTSVSTNSTTWAGVCITSCPPGRTRTFDRLVKSQLLYRLSYKR